MTIRAAVLLGAAALFIALYQLANRAIEAHGVRAGAQLYQANCAACHGARLQGQAGWQSAGWRSQASAAAWAAPPLDAGGHSWMHDDASLFLHTKNGSALSPMPGFGATLSDNEIWQVFAYVKSHWPESVRAFQRKGDPYAPLPADLPADWTYPPACEPGVGPGDLLR
ncbi:c-type cytochrome [Dongia mobilis]|uniref:c-type cytochrome n=1 Tax=Dongia mobilis TaxID=578943 RepID=UPI001414D451|nr:c-type cytochrome [Dongia mobilis]